MKDFTKANAELKKVMDYFTKNQEAFEAMNLKLHDASFYAYRDIEKDYPDVLEEYNADDLFYWFCDNTYDQFTEWCAENSYAWEKRSYIGRTSWFYLHDNSIIEFTGRYKDEFNWEYMLYNLIDHLGYNDTVPDITPEGKIDENDKWIEDCEANIEYIEKNFFNDVKREFKDVIQMYEYIKDTKDNQVDYFKEYLDCRREEIEWNKEQEEKRREEEWLDLMNVVFA